MVANMAFSVLCACPRASFGSGTFLRSMARYKKWENFYNPTSRAARGRDIFRTLL